MGPLLLVGHGGGEVRNSLFRCLADSYASNFPPGMFHDKIPQAFKIWDLSSGNHGRCVCCFNNALKHCKKRNRKIKRLAILYKALTSYTILRIINS